MSRKLSAFALHIWDAMDIDTNRETKRRMAGLKRIENNLSVDQFSGICTAIHRMAWTNSSLFIKQLTHSIPFHEKMEFLSNLAGM